MSLHQIIKAFLSLGLLVWTSLAFAFPEYTTRENAIRLAKVLDKGHFKSYQIASVFVKNRSDKEYYLQVILEDGSKQDWMLDQIYEWTLTDQLKLPKNQVLVFPSDESTVFYVLDKNAFHRLVLTSQAFVKQYPEHDMLFGKSMKFGIRRFQLIQLEEKGRYSTDRYGNRYRYTLDLQNGAREVLTYLDAYELMVQGAFIQQTKDSDVVLKRPFHITRIAPIEKQLEDELRNIWRFGIEVTFNQPLPLTEDLFPFQLVEESTRHPKTGERRNNFYIQILFPNTEKVKDVTHIRTLEYLQHVQVVTDLEHQKRVFLRAQVPEDVFELPPYIVTGPYNTLQIYFFLITDQSVALRPEFTDASTQELLVRQSTQKSNEAYEQSYLQAVELIRSVQGHHSTHLKVTRYFLALDALQEAALVAHSDAEIAQALAQRDMLLDTLPKLVIQNTQHQLRQPEEKVRVEDLKQHLNRVESITINRELLKQIHLLQSRL